MSEKLYSEVLKVMCNRRTYLNDSIDSFYETKNKFYDEPIEIQRYYFKMNYKLPSDNIYADIIRPHNVITYSEYNDKFTLSLIEYNLHFNKKPYHRAHRTEGFTYNKETKKVSFWFGSNIKKSSSLVEIYLRYINADWFFQMSNDLQSLITKTIFEDIIHNKITNPKDYIKKWMSISLKYKFSHRILFKFMEGRTEHLNLYNTINKVNFLRLIIKNVVSPENTLRQVVNEEFTKEYLTLLYDMFDESEILGFKINTNWSLKRLNNEHLNNSRKIRQLMYEHGHITNEEIDIKGELTLPDNVRGNLIVNEMAAYDESLEQNNCVYSTYWSRIKSQNYFVLSIQKPERCSVGIEVNYNTLDNRNFFYIQQIYGKSNSNVSDEIKTLFNEWLTEPNTQDFFYQNVSDEMRDRIDDRINKNRKMGMTKLCEITEQRYEMVPI